MKIKINDYFDFEKANALLEGFSKSTGFVTAIMDLEGNILSKSGWRSICNDFHRKNCETASNCIFSDTKLARQISKDEKYHFYKCLNGLIDVGLPIVIRGEHVANFFSGQFFFEKPDFSFFVKQAQKYGFDEKAYIEALKEVPVVSKEKAETVIHFLTNITQMIIEMTAEKLELTELNQELKNSRADFMANQELLDRNLKDLKESQRVAHESEERFQLLFNKAPLGYQSLDQDGRFIEVNQKWLDTLGYTREEVIGKWFGDFLCPEFVEGFRQRFPLFKARGQIHSEYEMLCKDGQRIVMSFEGKIGYSADGEFKQTHCILQDITDQRMAELALVESEKRYKQLSEQSRTYTWEVDEQGLFTFVDSVCEAILGYRSEELIQKKHFYDLCPKEDRDRLKKDALDIFERKGFFHEFENKALTKTGVEVVLSTNGFPVLTNDGSLKGYRGSDRDITARKRTEEALRKSEERFRVVQEVSPDGFTILHPVRSETGEIIDFAWVYENQAIANINQTDPQKIIGKRLLDIFPDHRGTIIFEAYKHAANTGETQILEEINAGEVISKPAWLRLVVVSMGEDIAILAQDITDRKAAENELLYLSYHDHLTGLYNRRYFEQELKNLDTPENLPLSIIMFDVNGLKLVNDSFGHDLGDVLLKKSAEAIKKACREDDIAARIGGDEFVVLLPKTAASEALQISNYIKELASDVKAANLELSISYGYDTKKTDNQSIIDIITNAENHMYRHKLYERSSIRSKITDLIMNTLFEKSSREAAHSNRVSIICQSISSKLNMGKDAVNKMKIAGLIHDIGKIGVDERILNKPGSLTAEERGFIERHPEIGWRLLSSTDEFSELAKYVLSHHENWDGTGYPNGLKGETIPLEARIISVADTYDAMTSERSYRKKMSREEAVKELKRCSGTQFDPMIVDVFLNEVLSEDSFR